MKAAITIRLCLAKNILANVSGISIAKGLWEKHEHMYQAKSLSNRLYLKKQFHTLGMEEGMRILDHMRTLNGIILDLEVIGAVISDKDKALRLFWYLPTSYEHIKPILMFVFGNDKNASIVEHTLVVKEGKKKNFGKVVC